MDNELSPTSGPDYKSWQEAAMGGNLLSYAWANRPDMQQLVPGYSPDEPWWLKAADVASVPARLATNALVAPVATGAQAMDQWMRGEQGPDTQKMITQSVLGLLGLNRVPGAAGPAGSLGVFAGSSARGADLDALREAQQMTQKGIVKTVPPESQMSEIWRAKTGDDPATVQRTFDLTGWYKDVDGKWKYEIPDVEANLKPSAPIMTRGDKQLLRLPDRAGMVLGDVLYHPALAEAYPDIMQTPVRGLGLAGALNPGVKGAVFANGEIGLAAMEPEEAVSTLLHEVQHKIQDREGFAQGGNAKQFLPEDYAGKERANLDESTRLRKIEQDLGVNGISLNSNKAVQQLKATGELPSATQVPENPVAPTVRDYLALKTPEERDALRADYNARNNAYWDARINQITPEHVAEAQAAMDKFGGKEALLTHLQLRENAKAVEDALRQQRVEAFDKYQRLAGEVEARNVQERRDQGDMSTVPTQTQGYPTAPQIVRFIDPEQKLGATHGALAPGGRIVPLSPIEHDPFAGATQ